MLRRPSKWRRLLPVAWLSAIVGLPAAGRAAEPAASPALQDIAELEQTARAEAQRLLPPLTTTQRLVVGPLQPQLQLARCASPIRSARAPGIQVPGRVLIELRCDGSPPWHLYVPARVVGTTPVVLAAHAIVAGTVLGPTDFRIEQRDVLGLPQGYLDDPGIAAGLTAARAIAGGTIVTNQELMGAQAVQRGQTVTLVAEAGGISIRMAGRALSDGFVNQRVRVENLSSGKIVEGIARSPQVVEIIF